ncbi:MAG TPA: PAS domain S-box protein, partial [Thermoanaerobaculia bacterium]|nr:PAS domain S-box protein [Thermoanaerobaculia bacterium]
PAAEKLLKLQPTDVGRSLKDLQPAFDLPDCSEIVSRVIETMTPIEREIVSSDGRWYLLRLRPYRTTANRIEGAVLLFFDIDPLKRTIEGANRSRLYAEALVDTVRESLVVLDRKLRVRTANRAFYESFRVSPINTEGKLLFELGGEWGEASPAFRTFLEDAFAGAESRNEDVEIDSVQMGHRKLVVNARPVRLSGEPETLLLLAIEDVTDARQATTDLSESEARYRKLFETAREAIWLLDGEKGEILDANPFAAEIFGYPLEELLGRQPWDLALYHDAEEAKGRFRETLREGLGFAPDVEMRTRDGRTIRVEKVSSTYTVGTRTVVQSNMRDLTERRQLEEELRHAQKMESIGRLAGGIAHDFNNILNIISAYSTLLAKGDAGKRTQSLEAIEKAVDRGAALVRQLLTFARRETMKFEPVDVNSIVREVASMIQETFPRSISIGVELEPEVPRINANPSQLHQALLNLCVNARDAMPKGGNLQLATALARGQSLRARRLDADQDRYVCIGVSDTGTGMDEGTRGRIFEPFFSTKGKEQGSGLGLAVVYGVAKTHGGFVDVESKPGDGSRFSIYLPVGSPDAEQPSPERD